MANKKQGGAILLAILIFILVSSLAASSLFLAQSTQTRREREEQLLFVGNQFRQALVSYYNTVPPGGARSLPRSIDDLVADQRFPQPVHHLRRIYLDPVTGKAEWRLVMVDGFLVGVSSTSEAAPVKVAGFPQSYEGFSGSARYSDWVFRLK